MPIAQLLLKIGKLAENKPYSSIEVDLMLDYTRQLYAELLETKPGSSKAITNMAVQHTATPSPPIKEVAPPVFEQPKPTVVEWTIPPVPIHAAIANENDEGHDSEEETGKEEDQDIRLFIGINDKYQMISELFGNDKAAYERMIDQLNTFDTEFEALQWLQDKLYFEYSWGEDSEALMILHAILHKFYAV